MSVITDTRAFAAQVQGRLQARFELNADRTPYFEQDEEDPTLRHYTILLGLDSPKAEDIDSVTYFIDDPTFRDDPVAASDDPRNNFEAVIFSYGEVTVEATVLIGPHAYKQRVRLSDLLEAGHRGDSTPEIRDAIQRIKNH